MSEYNELDHTKEQLILRAKIEALKLDLYAKRKNMVKICNSMIEHFNHSCDNAETIKIILDTNDHIDFDDIDIIEYDWLIRDHDQYSTIMNDIIQLKQYKILIDELQESNKKLDY